MSSKKNGSSRNPKAVRLAWVGIVLGLINSFMWFGKFKGWWN